MSCIAKIDLTVYLLKNGAFNLSGGPHDICGGTEGAYPIYTGG